MHMGGSSGASTSGGVAAESQQQRYAWASAYGYKVAMLRPVEWGLHLVEVLGCLASTLTALRAGAPALALWSLSALATSLASLYVMQRLPATFAQPQVGGSGWVGGWVVGGFGLCWPRHRSSPCVIV